MLTAFKWLPIHIFKETLERHNGRNPFRISKNPQVVYPSHSGILVKKYSPVHEVYNKIILDLVKGDIVDHITRLHCIDLIEFPEDKAIPLNVQHISIGLGIKVVGLALALLVFAIEFLHHWKH